MSFSGAVIHARHWCTLKNCQFSKGVVYRYLLVLLTSEQQFYYFPDKFIVSRLPVVSNIAVFVNLPPLPPPPPITRNKQANGSTVCVLAHSAGSMPVRHVQRNGDVPPPNGIANVSRLGWMCDSKVCRAGAAYDKVCIVV